jgi:hypothetical protein
LHGSDLNQWTQRGRFLKLRIGETVADYILRQVDECSIFIGVEGNELMISDAWRRFSFATLLVFTASPEIECGRIRLRNAGANVNVRDACHLQVFNSGNLISEHWVKG